MFTSGGASSIVHIRMLVEGYEDVGDLEYGDLLACRRVLRLSRDFDT